MNPLTWRELAKPSVWLDYNPSPWWIGRNWFDFPQLWTDYQTKTDQSKANQ